jgi:hypothetical protein
LIYQICDFDNDCDTALVVLNVSPVNDLPSAENDSATVNNDSVLELDVLTNDSFGGDGPAIGPITIVNAPINGNAVVDDGGTPDDPTDDVIIYTPDSDYSGPDSLIYEICDGNGDCISATVYITILPTCITINTAVYIEGAAVDPEGTATYYLPMRTDLNNYRILPGQSYLNPFNGNYNYTLPGQPYDTIPWEYMGDEGLLFDSEGDPTNGDADYPATVVDWVLVSLRDNPEGTGGPLCQAAALLHKGGEIQFMEEFECCNLDVSKWYYVVIEHRNHLIVMSDTAYPVVNGTLNYDFRIQQSYNTDPFFFSGQKEIQAGKFAMISANGDQQSGEFADTDITGNDLIPWEGDNGDIGLYRFGDYNLNGDANYNDRKLWEFNNGKITSVPRN